MAYYQITAMRTIKGLDGTIVQQVPMFFLNEDIQGIMNEDMACQIAKDILEPYPFPLTNVSISAVKVEIESLEARIERKITKLEADISQLKLDLKGR